MSERRRRRSRDVTLWAVPLLAASFVACGGDDDSAYCVDQNDQIVENENCDDDAYRGGGSYFWYYGGSAAGGRYLKGTKLKGGDKVSTSNIAENARRGGFGSSGRSSASGVGRAVSSHSGGG